MNGEAVVKYGPYNCLVSTLTSLLNAAFARRYIEPPSAHTGFVFHIFRERNERADDLTKRAAKGTMIVPSLAPRDTAAPYLRVQTDGSADAKNSRFSIGGAVWFSEEQPVPDMLAHGWTHALDFCRPVKAKSAPEVELMALACGVVYMLALLLPEKIYASLLPLHECADLQACTQVAQAMERQI